MLVPLARLAAQRNEAARLLAADGVAGYVLGHNVSVDAGTAVLGVPFDDDRGDASGSTYVFVFPVGARVQQAKLTAGDGRPDDWFGGSVSAAGAFLFSTRIAVGAPRRNLELRRREAVGADGAVAPRCPNAASAIRSGERACGRRRSGRADRAVA